MTDSGIFTVAPVSVCIYIDFKLNPNVHSNSYIASLFAGCAATGAQLTTLEEEKLDPALKQLVLGTSVNRTDYDVTPGAPGRKNTAS